MRPMDRKAENFFDEVIRVFGQKYPDFREKHVSLIKVLHAFSDKLPLIHVLTKKNLLSGLILKRSSSHMQPHIVEAIHSSLPDKNIILPPDFEIAQIQEIVDRQPIVIGDHGGYFSSTIASLSSGTQKPLGVTEHTVNGHVRMERTLRDNDLNIAFLSSARSRFKAKSDNSIAQNIIDLVLKKHSEKKPKNIFLIGYGKMGQAAGRYLKSLGYDANVFDNNPKKNILARQDGMNVLTNKSQGLKNAQIVLLATNTIAGQTPVLSSDDFQKMPDGCFLTSMTSIHDEVDLHDLEACGQHIKLLYNGCSLNSVLENGGTDETIYLIEALGIVNAFVIATGNVHKAQNAQEASNADMELLEGIWKQHFTAS